MRGGVALVHHRIVKMEETKVLAVLSTDPASHFLAGGRDLENLQGG
jgi:hypothetical protein